MNKVLFKIKQNNDIFIVYGDCIKIFSSDIVDKIFFTDILKKYKPFRKGPFSIKIVY